MSGAELARYPNLWKRGSRYYVRVRVPADLRAAEKREHVAVSLGTSDQREAVRRYRDVHGRIEQQFEALRSRLAGRDAITAALNSGRLESLSDPQVERMVRDWFEARERLRQPAIPLGEDDEVLRELREEAARLDEIDPMVADVARTAADRLLVDAGRKGVVSRRPVLRVGKVTNLHPDGTVWVRSPCIEATMPTFSGMSGGPAFLYSPGSEPRVFGLLSESRGGSSDPTAHDPEAYDRSKATRPSTFSVIPRTIERTFPNGAQVAHLKFTVSGKANNDEIDPALFADDWFWLAD